MRLNHINLVVNDVASAIKLFETHFGFTCSAIKGEHVVAILKGSDDFTLVLMTAKEDILYPDAFHIGFMQSGPEAVVAIYEQLRDAGIEVGQEPRKIRDSFGFYFKYDRIMIEIGYYLTGQQV